MGEKSQIHIQVESDKKEQWMGAVDDHDNARSLTQLIEIATNREINGRNVNNANGEPAIDLSSVTSRQGEMITALERIEGRFDAFEERLTELEREIEADTSRMDIEQQILHTLPPAKPHSDKWKNARPDGFEGEIATAFPDSDEGIAWSGKPDHIGAIVGAPVDSVEYHLSGMPPKFVEKGEIDGETRYWKSD